MSRYSDQFTDDSTGVARPIVGAKVYVYRQVDGALASITDDLGQTANPLTTDSFGNFAFTATDGLYDLTYTVAGREVFKEHGVPVGALLDVYRGPNGATASNLTIGLFTGANGQNLGAVAPDVVFTSGYSAIGKGAAVYVKDAVVDAAFVTAHPTWAFRSAAGVGYRISTQNDWTPQMFGAVGDGTTDDLAAFTALISALVYFGRAAGTNYRRLTNRMVIPDTEHYLSGDLEFTNGSFHVIGRSAASSQNGQTGARLIFAPGKCVRVESIDTLGEATVTAGIGGIGTQIENISITPINGTGAATTDGFHIRGYCRLINCNAYNWPRHGANFYADVGGGAANRGNDNLFKVIGGNYFLNGACGIHTQGGDSNAYCIYGVNLTANGTWGFGGDDFLGGSVIGCHTDTNGVKGAGTQFAPNTGSSMCSYSGNTYVRVRGQEVGASTNAPSGTTASNAYWGYSAAGGPSSIAPAWVSGMTVIDGGPYLVSSDSARTEIVSCYSEGTQPNSIIGQNSMVIGGLHAAGVMGNHLFGFQGTISSKQAIGSTYTSPTGAVIQSFLGSVGVNPGDVTRQFGSGGTVEWREHVNTNGDIFLDYLSGPSPWSILGPTRTQADDRYRLALTDFLLGSSSDVGSVKLGASAAMPTTGYFRAGSFVHSIGATVSGGKILTGWKRLVTGSAHVLNTDWCACYATTT